MSQITTQTLSPVMPNTESVSTLPKREQKSARKVAQYLWDQYQKGIQARLPHFRRWISVLSILRGIHWFELTKTGLWREMVLGDTMYPKVPILRPRYRWELGRLNSSSIGVTATPRTGHSQDAFFHALRAEAILGQWIEEENINDMDDRANQRLLTYGLIAYHPHIDAMGQTVNIRALPGSQLFPVPCDAASWAEADGIMHASVVAPEWLEMQDALLAAQRKDRGGDGGFKRMARAAQTQGASFSDLLPTMGLPGAPSSEAKGALGISVWMKPNPQRPYGEFMFMLNDEIYRYWAQPEEGVPDALPGGKIPLYPLHYDPEPEDFWGESFCGQLIAPQLEANRQMRSVLISAKRNKPLTFVDTMMMDSKDAGDEDAPFISFSQRDSFSPRPPAYSVGAPGVNRDTMIIMDSVNAQADVAAAHDSEIIKGKAEGRVEGGPATNMLNVNAQIPLQSVLDRKFRVFKQLYPVVLQMLEQVWPAEKKVQAVGDRNFGREYLIQKGQFPKTDQVVLTPLPMVAGGRNTMLQMLMAMRQMPGPDKGFELSSREFRKSLKLLHMSPPGIPVTDPVEDRIRHRIKLLVNDGQTPATAPVDMAGAMIQAQQATEDHKTAVELLRETILDPGFPAYSTKVQAVLLREQKWHGERIDRGMYAPDQFDTDVVEADAALAEDLLHAAEQDMDTNEGIFSMNDVAIGA